MTTVMRKIVNIDESKCDGCGLCVPVCAEGALQIIDGKARLISEQYCDGLGACLGECPQEAIIIQERQAEDFDEAAVQHHLAAGCKHEDELPCGCPSATVSRWQPAVETVAASGVAAAEPSRLQHWPVQLTLVPPAAPFLQDADLILVADCVPFAYASFHRDFLTGHAVLVACPKLDDFAAHRQKLTDILRRSRINSIKVVHMEVPCCSGLVHLAQQAVQLSGKSIPVTEATIGIRGDLKSAANDGIAIGTAQK